MEEIYKRRSILRTNILTKHTERDLTELVERMRDLRESLERTVKTALRS